MLVKRGTDSRIPYVYFCVVVDSLILKLEVALIKHAIDAVLSGLFRSRDVVDSQRLILSRVLWSAYQ